MFGRDFSGRVEVAHEESVALAQPADIFWMRWTPIKNQATYLFSYFIILSREMTNSWNKSEIIQAFLFARYLIGTFKHF